MTDITTKVRERKSATEHRQIELTGLGSPVPLQNLGTRHL
jgi:hypothetical protein